MATLQVIQSPSPKTDGGYAYALWSRNSGHEAEYPVKQARYPCCRLLVSVEVWSAVRYGHQLCDLRVKRLPSRAVCPCFAGKIDVVADPVELFQTVIRTSKHMIGKP